MVNVELFFTCVRAIERAASFVKSESFVSITFQCAIARLEVVEDRWKQCVSVHDELVNMSNGSHDIRVMDKDLEKAENGYFEARAALQGKIDLLRHSSQSISAPRSVQVELQYPLQHRGLKNDWGEFDGSLTKRKGFLDRFKSARHDSEQFAPEFKFEYSHKSIVAKAERRVGEWQLTDGQYHEEWEHLHQLHGNKYQTCREYMRQFYRLPFLERPSADALRHMSSVTHETLLQLRAQGLPVEHWDMIVVHNLHERLDEETGRAWELQRQSETPTAGEMLAFLDKQATGYLNQVSERCFRETDEASTPMRIDQNKKREKADSYGASSKGSLRRKKKKRKKMLDPCHLCRREHGLYKCPQFLKLNIRSRTTYVEQHNLCPNCLKQRHYTQDCYGGPSCGCTGKIFHNSIICPSSDAENHVIQKQSEESINQKSIDDGVEIWQRRKRSTIELEATNDLTDFEVSSDNDLFK